jgi:hypothetical protein
MERLDELIDRRGKLVYWIAELKGIMESIQTFIPVIGQAVHSEMRREVAKIDLEVLDIHAEYFEALREDRLKSCVSPREPDLPLEEGEIPF